MRPAGCPAASRLLEPRCCCSATRRPGAARRAAMKPPALAEAYGPRRRSPRWLPACHRRLPGLERSLQSVQAGCNSARCGRRKSQSPPAPPLQQGAPAIRAAAEGAWPGKLAAWGVPSRWSAVGNASDATAGRKRTTCAGCRGPRSRPRRCSFWRPVWVGTEQWAGEAGGDIGEPRPGLNPDCRLRT
jgi:hypothetical protein